MDKTKLYSPNQVGIGSFLGGPFAAIYFVWSNFRAMGSTAEARTTMILGVIVCVALLFILPVLPESFPNLAIPIVYTVVARLVAEKMQMSKADIERSETYGFQSVGNVAGFAVALLVAFVVVFFAWILALAYFGLVTI